MIWTNGKMSFGVLMEHIPEGPEGIILESLLEGMAEYYSAELAQKVSRGLRETRINSMRIADGKVVIDDKPNKHYVCSEKFGSTTQKIKNICVKCSRSRCSGRL